MKGKDETGTLIYRTALGYDKLEHVSSQKEEVSGGQFVTTHSYDWDDRVTSAKEGDCTEAKSSYTLTTTTGSPTDRHGSWLGRRISRNI